MKVFFTILAMLVIALFTYKLYQSEMDKVKLRSSSKVVYADILDLRCGRSDMITFRLNGKTVKETIYLNTEECNELRTAKQIGLKIGRDGTIVFAKDNYNDWAEAELYAILGLGALFMFCAFYYGILSDRKKT